jgi:hypothetical protein
VGLGRRAKYGTIDTDRGDTLVFHLGMSGRWRIDPTEIEKHDHFLLETDEGHRLALNDPRRFGSVDLVPTEELRDWPRSSARARAARPRRARASSGGFAAGPRRSSCCCSISDRGRASATSMSARRSTAPGSIRSGGGSVSLDG